MLSVFFSDFLRTKLSGTLPGWPSQKKMAPVHRTDPDWDFIRNSSPRSAAVLIPFIQRDGLWYILLTERSAYAGAHSGQMSFPGGKLLPGETPEQAALRETEEETGLLQQHFDVLGRLTEVYIPPSHFMVTPIVAIYSGQPVYQPDTREVSSLVEIPLAFFLHHSRNEMAEVSVYGDMRLSVPAFVFQKFIIWGATSLVLSELIDLMYDEME
jgi:mutator protein MutT